MTHFKFTRITLILVLFSNLLFAQATKEKYPSLLWEITGNGLKKPSYLFGTMHVSNKLVFHLGDSFYNAIRNTETVALELNPDLWQEQMVHLERLKVNYTSFSGETGNEYLTENSFRIRNYMDELKLALQSEPAIVNNLLYRSYKQKEDFEEDTFLDLYIFQTGRKLGKKPAGVENYYETEKLVMEAYADMAKEKKKKNLDLGDESISDIVEKMENAYRSGNLDLMDSLDIMIDRSAAFREKFLYRRNELQADAMDSIMHISSLFVGVGAAHLPGSRGVIELLRKKGYILRPVKMASRNALRKNSIDDLKVPVSFQKKYADDNFYSVDVPGDLYGTGRDYYNLDRKQYADMSNGSYYLVTRVKTHAALMNETVQDVFKKTDSILYENIPGKIQSRKTIQKNGYSGFDITSKTRRGDLQRYNIFITPFEVLVFKMSGKENYVSGKEAEQFFASINLKENTRQEIKFIPVQGGFRISLPQQPLASIQSFGSGDRWEYEAADKTTGDAYSIFKKSIYNYNFIDEDSFDLGLMEESFRNPDLFEKQVIRKFVTINGLPALEVQEKLKNGAVINALFLINGPHYYVVAHRPGRTGISSGAFFGSFGLEAYRYPAPVPYIDTFLKAKVNTMVVPRIDEGMRKVVEEAVSNASNGINSSGYFSYWPKPKYGVFKSDSTGEMIRVKVQEFPKYFSIRDSAKYWSGEIEDLANNYDMAIRDKIQSVNEKNYQGIRFALQDTGSGRIIEHLVLIAGNNQYTLSAAGDTVTGSSAFMQTFFNSFQPIMKEPQIDVGQSKLNDLFADLESKDTMVYNKAYQSLSSIYYGPEGLPLIADKIEKLNKTDKHYFEVKSKFIAELGYIKETAGEKLVPLLKKIYDQTADTSLFQNEVVKALARLKTKTSYKLLKELFLQDPPIFENNYDYSDLFDNLKDTLELSAMLFPELLQLATLDDYKENIINLLVILADSGLIKSKSYEAYLPNLYIDAKVALKKQQAKDEKGMQEDNKKEAEGSDEPERDYDYNDRSSGLENYSVLLMPFYESNRNVQLFFSRQLQSRDKFVRLNAAIVLLRNKKPVDDSVFLSLALEDKYRSALFTELETIKRLDKFPRQFYSQPLMARSFLINRNEYDKLDSMEFITKLPASVKGRKGFVYCYKYRVKKDEQWKIGLSGLQPENESEISSKDEVTEMTDVKLKEEEPVDEQVRKQLKKVLFGFHKSGKYFFNDYNGYGNIRSGANYQD
jgi:uncharacterized protein YbaP (TraB family)